MRTLLVFTNGRIDTMDVGPRPEVVLVANGRIEGVGAFDLLGGRADVEVVDLGGRRLLPGFVDAHHHLSVSALHPLWADLLDVDALDVARERLLEVARVSDAPWIRGCNWSRDALRLTRDDLDALGLDRPVIVACVSLHRCVVSSAGLDALGISASSADPPGGRIQRDRTGQLSGLLLETAWSRAHAASVEHLAEPDRYADLIEARARELWAFGITAVHDATMSPRAEAAYRLLASQGRLPISILGFPHSAEILTGPDQARWDGMTTGQGDARFRVGPVKVFGDGAYPPACGGHVDGSYLVTGAIMPSVADHVRTAIERGFGVAVHSLGNLGLEAALGAWEDGTRHVEPSHHMRIEHVLLAGEQHAVDMQRLGVAGVVQPGFIESTGDSTVAMRFEEHMWMPFAMLAARDVTLAASSDFPCSATSAPLALSRFGVSRRTRAGALLDAEQSLPMNRWLQMWTAGAADAGEQTNERGRLRPGLVADFVVLDGDDDNPEVAETWIAGERVYERA